MPRRIVVITIALVAAAGLLSAVLVSQRTGSPGSAVTEKADDGGHKSTTATPATSGSPQPPEATATPSSPRPTGDVPRVENLSVGAFSKSGIGTTFETDAVRVPAGSLALVHLMSCCDHAAVPTVAGPDLPFELAVTHETGEKRHWVFAASPRRTTSSGPLTITFAQPQGRVLWIVDLVSGADLGDDPTDAIVQTAWQDSQTNASEGSIQLDPLSDETRSIGVAFALAGSGTAVDIRPLDGARETAEVEVEGSSLIINTFWGVGQDHLRASFLDQAGEPAVESWLFLALEIRAPVDESS